MNQDMNMNMNMNMCSMNPMNMNPEEQNINRLKFLLGNIQTNLYNVMNDINEVDFF